MIFPLDVQKRAEDMGRLVGENKKQLIITLFIVGNLFAFFGLRYVFLIAGIDPNIGLIVQIVAMIIIEVYVFRFAIFHEDEKKREYRDKDSDSFARYMALRKDSIHEYDFHNERMNVFEYVNGSVVSVLEFRFGANDKVKAAATRNCYREILHLIGMYGFVSRITIGSENFGDSLEFKSYIDSINRIEDPVLRISNMEIAEEALRLSEKEGNVDIIYLSISSKGGYKLDELQVLLREIFNVMRASNTAFRSIHSLIINELMEFFRYFYGIEAIDLTMMKTIDLANEIQDEFVNIIETIILRGESGKTYSNMKDIDNMFVIKEKKLV